MVYAKTVIKRAAEAAAAEGRAALKHALRISFAIRESS